jgi:hypothetical protein
MVAPVYLFGALDGLLHFRGLRGSGISLLFVVFVVLMQSSGVDKTDTPDF